jgi:O-antigen/teichoic acid export membrane protein
MKPQIRILLYSILFFTYSISTSLLLVLGEKLKDHKFITLGCGFLLLNIIFSLFVLKWTPLLSIICSIVIAALALFLALKFGDLHLFSKYDTYGVKTALMAYPVFSIIFWEIVYQVKSRRQ